VRTGPPGLGSHTRRANPGRPAEIQLGRNSAYLAPGLVFALIDTFLTFGIGIEPGCRGRAGQAPTTGVPAKARP